MSSLKPSSIIASKELRNKLRNSLKSPLFIRRIIGDSMQPAINPGQVCVFIRKTPKQEDICLVNIDGRDVVKRIVRIRQDQLWLEGDNLSHSTDSRSYGWIDMSRCKGVLAWPKKLPVA